MIVADFRLCKNILSHINMGNAPDVIGRGSDSAPYFYVFFNQRHDAHLENRYTHAKTSHLTKPRSNPLIYN